MEQPKSLDMVIQEAIGEWCVNNSQGMLTNFLFIGEFIDDDGIRGNALAAPPDTSIPTHLGLAHYGVNVVTEMQRRDILHLVYGDCDDEDL